MRRSPSSRSTPTSSAETSTAVRPWLFTWGELGLIQICGKNAASIDAIVAACKAIAGHPGVVRLQDFVINTDVIVLSTPEIAGLPYVISGLVAAGGLAAALSTADGLLLAIANALSHDVYYKMLDPNAPTIRRLTVARVLLFVVAVAAADLAATKPGDILAMVGWAFSLAMAGNFPALVMGVWWKRTTATGAVCGMIAGFGLCLFYLVTHPLLPGLRREVFRHDLAAQPATGAPLVDIAKAMALPNAMEIWPTLAHPLANKVGWFDLNNIACGLLGMPLGFLVIYVVSLLGKEPSQGDAGLRRRDPQAARPDGARRKDLTGPIAMHLASGALRGPASFAGAIVSRSLAVDGTRRSSLAIAVESIRLGRSRSHRTYWYFHLPNFILAALMYTLLGRALLGLMVEAEFAELHLAVLLPHHRSGRRADRAGDAEGDRAGGDLAVRRRLAVLAARRPALPVPVLGAVPRTS